MTDTVSVISRYNTFALNTRGSIFIGGMRAISDYTRKLYSSGFEGCVTSPVIINNEQFVLFQAVDGRGVSSCGN
jgi:hypothetical protein